jgi:hypothetical protein
MDKHAAKVRVRIWLVTVVVTAMAATAPLAAKMKPARREANGPLRKLIVEARELMFGGQYDAAAARFDAMSKDYPSSPAGPFYKAVTLIWKSYVDANLETGSRQYDGDIDSLLETAIGKAELIRQSAEKSGRDDADALYYLGSAQATRSRLSLYQNHAIPAARLARMAQDNLEALIKLDAEYYDAYFAAGSLYYRVGLLTDSPVGRLATSMLGPKTLPVGDRERGLDYLRTAAEKSELASADAKFALIEALTLNENQPGAALLLALELQKRYPDNQTFWRYILRINAALNDRNGVAEAAQAILLRVKAGKPNFGRFMRVEAERFLAQK